MAQLVLLVMYFFAVVLVVGGIGWMATCRTAPSVLPPARVGRYALPPRAGWRPWRFVLGLVALVAGAPTAVFAAVLCLWMGDAALLVLFSLVATSTFALLWTVRRVREPRVAGKIECTNRPRSVIL